MRTFPLYAPNTPQQEATINTISTLSQQSPGSYDHGVVLSSFEISSLLPVSQDPIPLPSFSFGEHLMTSTHTLQRTKRKGGMRRKLKINKKSPVSKHHTGHPPLASANHAGGKVTTSSHHVGKKPTNGYHARTYVLYRPIKHNSFFYPNIVKK